MIVHVEKLTIKSCVTNFGKSQSSYSKQNSYHFLAAKTCVLAKYPDIALH